MTVEVQFITTILAASVYDVVGAIFGVQLVTDKYDEVTAAVNAVLGILVVLEIVSNPEAGKGYTDKD